MCWSLNKVQVLSGKARTYTENMGFWGRVCHYSGSLSYIWYLKDVPAGDSLNDLIIAKVSILATGAVMISSFISSSWQTS